MSRKKTSPSHILTEPLISLPKITGDDFTFKKVLAAFLVLLGVSLLILTIMTSAQLFYYPSLCPTVSTVAVRRPNDSQSTLNQHSIMNLGEVAVGKTFAQDGRVTKNERFFTNRDATISLSVELIGSETDRDVVVSLFSLDPRFPDNRTVVASQSAIITTENQDVIQFEFHRPEKSWPTVGKYQAVVEIPDSGSRKTVSFAIYR